MSKLRPASVATAPERSRFTISWPVQLALIVSASLYMHSLMWWTEPRDMTLFLRPWFDHIVRYGPVAAFAHPFSNYTPAYLYLLSVASLFHRWADAMFLIKLLSLAGTAFAIFAVADLIKAVGGKPRYALLLLATPTIVVNAALLAQCDAIWGGACVLAVAATMRGRTISALIWSGVAIAFKAQAVFIAPFIAGALIGRRAPVWQWAIPALVFAVIMFPAWLEGWPAWQLAMIYPGQAQWGDFPGRLANPWIFGTIFWPDAAKNSYWLGFAAVAAASAGIAALTSASLHSKRTMLLLALLSSLALPFFFPKMLERYFFLADLLSLALAISYCERATIVTACAVQLASFLSLLTYVYFYSRPYPTLVGALFAGGALAATYALARRSGAEWPRLNFAAAARPLASAGRTAA